MKTVIAALCTLLICFCSTEAIAKPVHHYVFFNRDRERIHDKSFLETRAFEGAQIKYTWRELEPEKDHYDFSAIRSDLAFLTSQGKKLFIQLQDSSFDPSTILVPRYLLQDKIYNGGADQQYDDNKGGQGGWVARRWDPAVQDRFHKLLFALGKEFDGKIEGINLPETSIGFGESAPLRIKGFTFEAYRDAVIVNMRALRRAFPKSVTMQYANFMPGEWLPKDDKGLLRAVYAAARELKVGVGGPDLLPSRAGQLNHSYPLIRESAGIVPTGIAVQDGNYGEVNPKTGKRPSLSELIKFATDHLKVDYIFWCTEEPFYSKELIPLFNGQAQASGNSTREVAVTFDDLPFQGQMSDAETLKRITAKLLRSLKMNGVPAFADVNERKLYVNGKPDEARVDILKMWLDAGVELGNHTFSHADLQTTPLADYEAEVVRGEIITRRLMQEKGMRLRYFRHPVLHTGPDMETKRAFERFLAGRGYTIAPVTIDNQDFMFADVYARAKRRGDAATMKRVGDAYVPYMEKMFDFFEQLSRDSLGCEVKQVLLLHANELNADYFDELARMMKRRGYSFITLEEALKDKAYSLPDAQSAKGLSWLHRWMLARGEQMRPEPSEPEFITRLFNASDQ